MQARLDHINMTVRNLKESVAWYGRYFGFEVVESGHSFRGPYAVIQNGSSSFCLHERRRNGHIDESKDSEKFHRINHFGLAIDNRELWERLFETENFTVTYSSPCEYPHSTSWYIADPDGHEIEVVYWNSGAPNFKGTPNNLELQND